jgi:hypothetical protein
VAFGSEMNYGARTMFFEQANDQFAVADVTPAKPMTVLVRQFAQVFEISCVCKCVQVDDRLVVMPEPVEDEIAADESGTSCDEDHRAITSL